MENNESKREKILTAKTAIVIAVLLVVAALSFFLIANVASSEESFGGTYASLDEKRTTVTELMAVTAGASTAISLFPGDAGTPIAEQLADLSGYFIFILSAIYLEKWLVTITGMVAFRFIIPIGCLILIATQFLEGEKLREMGIKLILFALMIFAVIPVSGLITDAIDSSYQASVQQTIDDAKKHSKDIQDKANDNKDKNALEKFFGTVKGKATETLDEFESLLNRITEAIAVMIVTSCAIPIAVLAFFLWLIKMMTGVRISIPRFKASKIMKTFKPE